MAEYRKNIYRTLTIAGSDSGGGAGIQADLKTFCALKTYGMSAITAITAQNTKEVAQVFELPQDLIENQISMVCRDIGVDAFKTGMLLSDRIIRSVALSIRRNNLKNFVLDPVMIAKSGDTLLEKSAIKALINELLPLADVITPNIPEAEIISDIKIEQDVHIRQALEKIRSLGPKNIVIKGGHLQKDPVDWVLLDNRFFVMPEKRIETKNTHGGGCTFAAAITAFLARGYEMEKAIWEAKKYTHKAIQSSLEIGSGHGPLHHFHPWYRY